ncbi:MAG: SDR family NAD(P)-dependent oxidoreductase [Tahibacter sp.]
MKGAVVIVEATSGIGFGLVQAAVSERRPVVAVATDASRLVLLKTAHAGADLSVIEGSIATELESAALAEGLRALDRPIDGILVSRCNERPPGRLLDQDTESLRRELEENLLPHMSAARHLLPLLAESGRRGSYIVIDGPGGEHPWAGYGHRSVRAAALNMLVRVLHNEARTLSVRVHLLTADTPVCTRDNASTACEQWPTALAIGRRALELLEPSRAAQVVQAVVRFTPTMHAESKPAREVTPAAWRPL